MAIIQSGRLNQDFKTATFWLVLINSLLFIIPSFLGFYDVLIQFGAKVNILIFEGQIWRIFTSAFLHLDFTHLLFNMLALWQLGLFIEKFYSKKYFLAIYFFSVLGSSLFSLFLNPSPSLGASGGIFGLFAVYMVWSFTRGTKNSRKGVLYTILLNLGLVLIFTIMGIFIPSAPGLDNWGHLGGFVFGLILSLIWRQEPKYILKSINPLS